MDTSEASPDKFADTREALRHEVLDLREKLHKANAELRHYRNNKTQEDADKIPKLQNVIAHLQKDKLKLSEELNEARSRAKEVRFCSMKKGL